MRFEHKTQPERGQKREETTRRNALSEAGIVERADTRMDMKRTRRDETIQYEFAA